MSSFPSFDQLYGFNQHIGQPFDAGPAGGAEQTQAIRNRNRFLNHSSTVVTDSIERINFINHDDYQMNIIHNENPHFIGDEI